MRAVTFGTAGTNAMHNNSSYPTQAERERWSWFQEIGCVACVLEDQARTELARTGSWGDVHHLLDGGVRRGHRYTVCLCAWHHRGHVPEDSSAEAMTDLFGPSLAWNKRAFHERYGSDDALLALTDRLVAAQRERRV